MPYYAVSPEGSVNATPQVINAERNTTVEFTCSALGGPGNNFTWIRMSDRAVVTRGSVLQIAVEDAFDGSDYWCLTINDAGNDTDIVTLNGMCVLRLSIVTTCNLHLCFLCVPFIQLLLWSSLNLPLQRLLFLRTSHSLVMHLATQYQLSCGLTMGQLLMRMRTIVQLSHHLLGRDQF